MGNDRVPSRSGWNLFGAISGETRSCAFRKARESKELSAGSLKLSASVLHVRRTEIAVPRARIKGEDGKTSEWKSK